MTWRKSLIMAVDSMQKTEIQKFVFEIENIQTATKETRKKFTVQTTAETGNLDLQKQMLVIVIENLQKAMKETGTTIGKIQGQTGSRNT
jgi:hypothetical protein